MLYDRSPFSFQFGGYVLRYSDSGHLRIPMHASEDAKIELSSRKNILEWIKQLVESHANVFGPSSAAFSGFQ